MALSFNVPECGASCLETALAADGCTDSGSLVCHCKADTYKAFQILFPCLNSVCSQSDRDTVVISYQIACARAGATIDPEHIKKAETLSQASRTITMGRSSGRAGESSLGDLSTVASSRLASTTALETLKGTSSSTSLLRATESIATSAGSTSSSLFLGSLSSLSSPNSPSSTLESSTLKSPGSSISSPTPNANPSANPPPQPLRTTSLPTATIAGIVVSATIILLTIIGCLWWYQRRKLQQAVARIESTGPRPRVEDGRPELRSELCPSDTMRHEADGSPVVRIWELSPDGEITPSSELSSEHHKRCLSEMEDQYSLDVAKERCGTSFE